MCGKYNMMIEMDSFTRLKQQLSKEYLTNDLTLTTMPVDFYPDVNSYIKDSDNKEALVMMAKLKRIRVTKLASLACVSTPYEDIVAFLSPEEQVLYSELLDSVDKYWEVLT